MTRKRLKSSGLELDRQLGAYYQAAPDLILNSNYRIPFFVYVTTEVLGTGDIEGSLAPI